MRVKTSASWFLIFFSLSCGSSSSDHPGAPASAEEIGNTCVNPDAPVACCFANILHELSPVMTIHEADDPGPQLIISGTFYKRDGKTPCPDVVLYAYHTDSKGHYSKSGNETGVQKWHGRHHGWCKSGPDGHYEIHTTRPARYPGNTIPAHIHSALKTDNGETYWINDFVFSDDSLVNDKYLSSLGSIGGRGVVVLTSTGTAGFVGKRDIILR